MEIFVKDRQFYRTLLTVAVPISLQSMVSFCVNLIDTVMLGKFGEVALSASSLGSGFFMILNVVCLGLGCGAAVITSQYWGRRETEPIRKMSTICFKLTFAAGLLFTAAGVLLPAQIMRVYTNEAAVIQAGADYVRYLALSFVFSSLATAMTQILRSVNIVKVTLLASVAACVANVFFNWVFIFGNLGAPALEVAGAAIATSIARFLEFAVIVFYLLRDKIVGFRLRHLRGFDADILRRYLKTGVAVLVSDLVMVIGTNLLTIIIGHIGSAFVAASSIANVVNSFIMSLFFGVSNASAILTGNTVGAGAYRRAYAEGKTFLALGVIIGVLGGALLYLIKYYIINIYDVTEETRRYAAQIINVVSVILPVLLMEHALTKGILRGGGDTKFLIFADTAFAYLVAAPLGYLAAFVWALPVWAVYLCLKSDVLCKWALCLWRFSAKKWIRDVTRQEPARICLADDFQ